MELWLACTILAHYITLGDFSIMTPVGPLCPLSYLLIFQNLKAVSGEDPCKQAHHVVSLMVFFQ